MGLSWFDDVRAVPIADALAAAGCSTRSRRWTPCPLCGEARERADRRGPVGLMRGRNAAHCNACHKGFDAIEVAKRAVNAQDKPSGAEWRAVQAWCAAHGWCEAPEGWAAPEVRRRAPLPPPEPRVYAPAGEARFLWDRAGRLDRDDGAVAWLADRVAREGDGDLDAVLGRIVATDAARVLPINAKVPKWARCSGYPWSEEGTHDGRGQGGEACQGAPVGWRLLLRAWDAEGALVGLRARSLWVGARHEAHRKEIAPIGGLPGGSVYACGLGVAILRGLVARPGDTHRGRRWSGAVVVREGGPDWLLCAGSPQMAEDPAVASLGMWSGSWVGEGGMRLARRLVAAGARVVVATDHDEAGDRYAAQIGSSIEVAGGRWVRGAK